MMLFWSVWFYCVIGLIVMVIISKINKSASEGKPNVIDEILKQNKPNTRFGLFLEEFLLPMFAYIFAIIAWPFLLQMQLKKDDVTDYKPKPFVIRKSDLLQELSIEQIEQHETITEPLNAVPKKPFGHLYKTWQKFKKKVDKDDEVWSFSTVWEDEWHYKERRSGYVIVSENAPKEFFITEYKNISDSIEFKL